MYGQRVLVAKIRNFESKNVHYFKSLELSQLSGFCLTNDLGKYLGVPILHGRKKKKAYNRLLDKTQARIFFLER